MTLKICHAGANARPPHDCANVPSGSGMAFLAAPIPLYLFDLSTILSENRRPLFAIMLEVQSRVRCRSSRRRAAVGAVPPLVRRPRLDAACAPIGVAQPRAGGPLNPADRTDRCR